MPASSRLLLWVGLCSSPADDWDLSLNELLPCRCADAGGRDALWSDAAWWVWRATREVCTVGRRRSRRFFGCEMAVRTSAGENKDQHRRMTGESGDSNSLRVANFASRVIKPLATRTRCDRLLSHGNSLAALMLAHEAANHTLRSRAPGLLLGIVNCCWNQMSDLIPKWAASQTRLQGTAGAQTGLLDQTSDRPWLPVVRWEDIIVLCLVGAQNPRRHIERATS